MAEKKLTAARKKAIEELQEGEVLMFDTSEYEHFAPGTIPYHFILKGKYLDLATKYINNNYTFRKMTKISEQDYLESLQFLSGAKDIKFQILRVGVTNLFNPFSPMLPLNKQKKEVMVSIQITSFDSLEDPKIAIQNSWSALAPIAYAPKPKKITLEEMYEIISKYEKKQL